MSLSEGDGGFLVADGFEEAFLGMLERCASPGVACYDAEKCIEILMKRDKMSRDEALEFFQFNTLGAWMGPGTPYFLWRKSLKEALMVA